MSDAAWSCFLGLLLILMMLFGTLLNRLPLSSALIYLLLGIVLGPDALAILTPDPVAHAETLERLAEIALLISLFAVGLRLGSPRRSHHWWLPVRLALLSMLTLVTLIAALGIFVLDLEPGAAVLLGAILAPTDPVLASGLRSEPGAQSDRLNFSLAAEGGLNDGAAYPFVLLGLGLLGLHDLGPHLLRWWTLDVLWANAGGLAVGACLGALTGRLVVFLRSRHREAVGLDVFLGLGLIALTYGLAQLAMTSGFLAVFACGLALQRVRERPRGAALDTVDAVQGHSYETLATHSHHASATMRDAVELFNDQLEKLAELALVLLLGAMLAYAPLNATVLWFVPLLLVVLRPLSTWPALVGADLSASHRGMIGWFGIRGVGSMFYLLFALREGMPPALTAVILPLTLWTIAASIVVHGISAQPLMRRHVARVAAASSSRA
ncbi:MAG: cation:proton antiporter [Gammaproteobacteria bacterium]|nr:cation:proton antiporter [Gammaproteobacteria bacterium]